MLEWFATTQGILTAVAGAGVSMLSIIASFRAFHTSVVKPTRVAVRDVMTAVRAVPRIEHRGLVTEGILRARIECSDDIAVYTDPAGEITTVTAGFTELTGLDAASSKRERWKLAIHPDDVGRVTMGWHESLRTGNTFVEEIRYTHVSKGGLVPCKVITSPVLVGDEISGWAANIKPIGDRIEYDLDPEAAKVFAELLDKK